MKSKFLNCRRMLEIVSIVSILLSLTFTSNSSWAIVPVHAQQSIPTNIQEYIQTVAPWAQAEERDSGVPASFSIAQSMHETGASGWDPNQKYYPSSLAWTYYNFHGIECSEPYEGQGQACVDLPNGSGSGMTSFNKYSSGANGFLWHGRWLKKWPNFASAFNYVDDPFKFAHEVLLCYTGCNAQFPQAYYDDIVKDINTYNLQQYDTVIDISNPDAFTCSQSGNIDFEAFNEARNLSALTIPGIQFTSTYSVWPWLVGDFASGNYNGKYPNGAYTSQGTHWAWLGEFQGLGQLKFTQGLASYFSLLVSSYTPVSVDAYDKNGNYLTTAGPSLSDSGTGHMTELKFHRAVADMAYVMVHDSGNYFLIDDICTDAPGTPQKIVPIFDQTYFMLTGQQVYGSFTVNPSTNAQQYLHVIAGPFNSDVDLYLTRPDGSIVSHSDPGVTYNKTVNNVEIAIDNASPGTWQYEIVANQLDAGGENIPIAIDNETVPNTAPTLTVPGDQTVQYSDPLNFNVSASDPLSSIKLVLSASSLPDGLTFKDNGDNTGTVSGLVTAALGNYPVQFTVTDPGGLTDTKSLTITVSPEDARTTYTGPQLISTADSKTSQVAVPLRTTIQDITALTSDLAYDQYPGDITKATVTYVNRSTNAVLCSASPTLLNPSDSKTGTATCNWTADIGSSNSQTFAIGTVVGGYYIRDNAADNSIVVVSKPITNFITGAGYILNQNSAGQYAGTNGQKTTFGLGITFIKPLNKLIGGATVLVRNANHIYLLESTTLSSLVVTPATKTTPAMAELLAKAKITDVTNPKKTSTVVSDVTMDITVKDYGEPGNNDMIGITVWGKNNALLYSSSWTGNKTAEQKLNGGNLYIYLDKSVTQAMEIVVPNSTIYLPLVGAK